MNTATTLESPFFIVGCGRSGTTLLRTMLNHHPEVAIPLESIFIIDYLRAGSNVSVETMKHLLIDEGELQEWNLKLGVTDLYGCRTAVDLITRLHELYIAQEGKRLWAQKTPRFVRYGELLKTAYPHAKFIHVIRDPRATVSSLIRSNVHNSNALYGSKRWLKDVRAGVQLKAHYPDDVMEVRYEDLVIEPEATLKQVCAFLALVYDPVMLMYHETGTQEYSKYYEQAHEKLNCPPSRNRIDAWRKQLSPREVALIETLCDETMRQFGYEPEYGNTSLDAGFVQWLKLQRFVGLSRQIKQYLTTRRQYFLHSIRRKWALGLVGQDIREINY